MKFDDEKSFHLMGENTTHLIARPTTVSKVTHLIVIMPLFRLTPLLAALLSVFACHAAHAAEAQHGPTTLSADDINGAMNDYSHAEGNVVVTRDDLTVKSDWLDYYQEKNRIIGGEWVQMIKPDSEIDGHWLDYYLDQERGVIYDATFYMQGKNGARAIRGNTPQLDMLGKNQYRLNQSRLTTCDPGREAWYLKSSTTDLNYNTNLGVAHHGIVEFKGVPILYTPYIDFPLDDRRKSGLLAPTYSQDSINGFDYTQPYYWNIAPNYDATFFPRYMANRGMQLGTEFRYLHPDNSGLLYGEYMERDALSNNENRFAFSTKQSANITPWLKGSIDYTRVSDNDYYRALGGLRQPTDPVNQLQQAIATITPVAGNTVTVLVQKYQTLQPDLSSGASPIASPYSIWPSVSYGTSGTLPYGATYSLPANLTQFKSQDPTLWQQQDGRRLSFSPTLSLPLTTSYGYITPKATLSYTQYQLDPMFNAGSTITNPNGATLTRSLPILSMDSGLYFERNTNLFQRDMVQTLEPRLFYVYAPYRDQSAIPIFDTSENAVNFAQIFQENRFSGGDRINDANRLTGALSTRYLDSATGVERLRLQVGQQISFIDQKVVLTSSETPQTNRLNNTLFGMTGQLNNSTSVTGDYQFNHQVHKTDSYNLGVRYEPGAGKTFSLNYRYDRQPPVTPGTIIDGVAYANTGAQRQLDLAIQWPITRQWYMLARQNYSLVDHTPLQQLAGVEYNGGCWALRLVAQRYVVDLANTRTAFFIQLELTGLGGIGSNPLEVLRQSIPGYRESTQINTL